MQALDLLIAEPALAHALTEQLEAEETLATALFKTPASAFRAWEGRTPDVILIDVDSFPEEALEKVADKASSFAPTPFLLFLGETPIAERLPRAESLAKPFRLATLLLRVRARLAPASSEKSKTYCLGPWRFMPERKALTDETRGLVQKLTDKETDLLEALAEAQTPLKREDLLQNVWGYNDQTDTHTLETHLYKLRRKLTEEDERQDDPFDVANGLYALSASWRKDRKGG